MRFEPTPLPGAFVIVPQPSHDARGFFARTFCEETFRAHGLDGRVVQCNLSFNQHRGTLRGLHFQAAPHGEAKLVTCIQGVVWDVIVDLRANSPTLGRTFAAELRSSEHTMMYVPEGFAHGFQTLEDASAVFYQMSSAYQPTSARGIHWNDPRLAIAWPIATPIVSPRDDGLGAFPVEGI
jgi:dTDP-4-dehydrorhamnose 3,5-epimerase